MTSTVAVPFWKSAGMTYITYSNICAPLVRNCLKEPHKIEAICREKVHFAVSKWAEGKPHKSKEEQSKEAAAAAAEEKKCFGSSRTNTSGTSEDHINGKKRPLSKVSSSSFEQEVEGEALPSSSSDAKRNRLLVHAETDEIDDEDWLRYDSRTSRENVVESLPPSVVVMEEDHEKIISRFASEVEGDCTPPHCEEFEERKDQYTCETLNHFFMIATT